MPLRICIFALLVFFSSLAASGNRLRFCCCNVEFTRPVFGDEPGSATPGSAATKLDPAKVEFFERKIRPVLVERCYECHAATAKSVKGGLRLDTRQSLLDGGESGEAIVPGDPESSMLLDAIKYNGLKMPPDGKLAEDVVADFETWIRDGAADPRTVDAATETPRPSIDYESALHFWAFQRPKLDAPPEVHRADWVRNDIDRFVLHDLEEAGLSPNPPAARETLLRRVTFDLIGLPPTPDELDRFLRDDSPDAYARVVDELLDSPHYGERWGRHWLDVARYGEDQAHTFKARNYPRGYFYRDWVVESLNQDLPYDQFLRAQIAGDLIGDESDRHTRLAALGLFALGPVYYAENVEQAKARADEWDDRIDTLMRGVLALTAACARCHDHKYDPISMSDYYALAGVFASTEYQERPVVSPKVQAARREADEAASRQQLEIDRFLTEQARLLRPSLVDDIPGYFAAVWQTHHRQPVEPDAKKRINQVAEQTKRSAALLKRWHDFLTSGDAELRDSYPDLADWFAKLDERPPAKELAENDAELAAARDAGERFVAVIRKKLSRRDELFRRFGTNVAFVRPEDRADVSPGVIPLGNLFDDPPGVQLHAALASDRNRAVATAESLGVDRVVFGWGDETEIAPDIRFNFTKLGSDRLKHGSVTNDGWNTDGPIITQGEWKSDKSRVEQGIGMHANALITFDLDEIRRAGLLPADQPFVFRADRAGINLDALGSAASAHLAVIVSRPQRDKAVTDSILAAQVNGRDVEVAVDDFTYYFAGEIGEPLKADARFASFTITVPPEAQHLTLVATGAGMSNDNNTISSDHTVFSGARLEFESPPDAVEASRRVDSNGIGATETTGSATAELNSRDESAIEATGDDADEASPQDERSSRDEVDAVLLSRLFYDEGLLALPAKEAEPKLSSDSTEELARLRNELDARKKAAEAIAVPLAHSLREGESRNLPIYLLGNPANHGDITPRSMPSVFSGGERKPFDDDGSGRLALADAVASPDNPLTARVIVNRIWGWHFGQGIVRTPSNFGQLGERPTHPELLDMLSVRFMQEGWSLKSLHRWIVLSATYQQSSEFDAAKFEADPENRLLWRANRRRLEIEPWRDALLAVSGELDPTPGGPSRDLADVNNRRRTLYGFVSRHRLDEQLRLFDFPDPNITADRRAVTTVPLQQLFVMNSDFMAQRAQALSKRVLAHSADDRQRLEFAWRLLYGRTVRADELDAALRFLDESAGDPERVKRWELLSLALLSSNEFMFVD